MRPLPNRVDPFGALHAVAARGMLMGNRGGKFHQADQTLGHRRWASRQWIACVCQFRGRARQVWGAGYTELFFMDEVTALAAGHRPCFECRRTDAKSFQAVFATGGLRAGEMDAVLHAERLQLREWLEQPMTSLPDGAMVARGGNAYAVQGKRLLPWTFDGYLAPVWHTNGGAWQLLTPPSIVQVLRRGYAPGWGGQRSADCTKNVKG